MPEKQYTAANALLKKLRYFENTNTSNKKNIDNQILAKFKTYEICFVETKQKNNNKSEHKTNLKLRNKKLIL